MILVAALLIWKPNLAAAANGTPTITLTPPSSSPYIGTTQTFAITFSNSGTAPGYGPYVDVELPFGVLYAGASLFGEALAPAADPFVCTLGSYKHPLTNLTTACTIGTQVIVLQYPFGSFVPSQTPSVVQLTTLITSTVPALVGVPLPIQATPGFIYGDSPTGTVATAGTLVSVTTTPILYTLHKTYIGPEDETATGPNYPRTYVLSAMIAPGQTLSPFFITDTLPNNIVILSNTIVMTPANGVLVVAPTFDVPAAGNQIAVRFPTASLTTTPEVRFQFYVSATNAAGGNVLDPLSGAFNTSQDNATSSGTWTAITGTVSAPAVTHTLSDESLSIQKYVVSNDTSNQPGSTLTYTLNFQVSDYFSLRNLLITDTIDNAQNYITNSAQLRVTDRNGTVSGGIAPAHTLNADGSLTLVYDVSAALQALGAADGTLQGGRTITPNAVAATGQLTFVTQVRDRFRLGNDNDGTAIQPRDQVTNTVLIQGDVVPNTNITDTTTGTVVDNSGTNLDIAEPELSKVIYAINGSTTLPSPFRVSPGDSLTYRLTYRLNTGDFKSLNLVDFVPLPIFKVLAGFAFVPGPATATPPVIDTMTYGPADTYNSFIVGTQSGSQPTLTSSVPNNSLSLNFGSHSDPTNTPLVIDLLFTLQATGDPFIDGLFLTNQVNAQQTNTPGTVISKDAIVKFKITEPFLRLKKGIIGTDNTASTIVTTALPSGVTLTPPPSACPRIGGTPVTGANVADGFNGNLVDADASDRITYAIVVQNTGAGGRGAFNVTVSDTLPSGMNYAGNLCVTDGAGSIIATSGTLTTGLVLSDPSATEGSISPGADGGGVPITNSTNLVLITFDAIVTSTARMQQTFTNTAALINYSSLPGGPNFISVTPKDNLADTATLTTTLPGIRKALIGTSYSLTNNVNNQAAIGEVVTYSVVIIVPEGIFPAALVRDALPAGFGYSSTVAIAPSSGITWTGTPTQPTFASPNLTFNFGTITNTNSDNTVIDTITVTYTAVVLDVAANTRGAQKLNSAIFSFSAFTSTFTLLPSVALPVTVVEPNVQLVKTVLPPFGDSGDPITYTLSISNPGIANASDAFNVVLTDVIPSFINFVPSSLRQTSGITPTSIISTADSFTVTFNVLTVTSSSTLVFTGTLRTAVIPGSIFTNTAGQTHISLPVSQTLTADPASHPRFYHSVALTPFKVTPLFPTKVVVSTSEPSTNMGILTGTVTNTLRSPRVAIGEIVAYQLQVGLPQGTAISVLLSLQDLFPAGLTFITDSARVALVMPPGATGYIQSTLITATNPAYASTPCADPNPATNTALYKTSLVPDVVPTCPFPSLAITYDALGNPSFDFGSIVNYDESDGYSYLNVQINGLVQNIPGNVISTSLSNIFTASVSAPGFANSTVSSVTVTSTVIVAEPVVQLRKTIDAPRPRDAGDLITYTLVASNAAGVNVSTAFDAVLTDVLDSNLTLLSVTIISSTGVSNAALITVNNALTLTADSITPTGAITLQVIGRVITNVLSGQRITNTAFLNWSSLPGPNGTISNPTGTATPGTPGSPTGERTGAGGFNTYLTNTVVANTLDTPLIRKLAITPTQYRIGDVITYTLLITLPEGVTQNLIVTDALPSGLQYVAGSGTLITSGTPLSATYSGSVAAPIISVAGSNIRFNFGPVTTTADDTANNNTFAITLQALVQNVGANTAGGTKANGSALGYVNPQTGTVNVIGNTINVTVIEPNLLLTKIVIAPRTPVGVGDVLTYVLTLANLGTNLAPAFDINLTDTLPSGIVFVSTVSATVSSPITATITDSNTVNATALVYQISQLNTVATATITFTARVQASVGANTTLTNVARATADSQPGNDPNQRVYTTTPATAVVSTSMPLSPAKLLTPVTATNGDIVTYTLRVPSSAFTSTLFNVALTDVVPSNLSVTSIISTSTASAVVDSSISNTVRLDFDRLDANTQALITITARLLSSTVNVSGTQIVNTVGIRYSNTPGGAPSALQTSNPVTLTVIQPKIATTKTVTPASNLQAGDVLTYAARFTNIGNSIAYNVVATDTLAPGTAFNGLLGCANQASAAVLSQATPAAGTVRFEGNGSPWTIPINGFIECSYTATVQSSLLLNGSYTNTIDANWTSQADLANPDNRLFNDTNPYTDTNGIAVDGTQDRATATFSSIAPQFSKSDGGIITRTIGDVITYTLTLTSPRGTLRNLVVTDTLPAGLTYISGTATISGLAPVSSTLTSQSLAWDFGNAVITTSPVIFVFRAQVVDVPANQAGLVLTNTAALNHANALGTPQAPLIGQDTVRLVEPNVQLSKAVSAARSPVGAGDVLTYVLRFTNTAGANVSPAYDLMLTDTLPSGVTFISTIGVSPTGVIDGNVAASSALTYTLDALAPGSSAVITFTARVDTGIAANRTLLNTARAVYSGQPDTPAVDRPYSTTLATATINTSPGQVDLRKTAAPSPVVAGTLLTYTLQVTNTGIVSLTGVVLTDVVPVNTTFVSAAPAGFNGPDAAQVLTYSIGMLDIGQTRIVTMVVQVNSAVLVNTQLTNTVRLTSTFGLTSTASVTTPVQSSADLLIIKAGSQTSIAGTLITYTLSYTNIGPSSAQQVYITDTLPSSVIFGGVVSAPSGWSAPTLTGQTLSWFTPTLFSGASGMFVFTVTVNPAATGQIVNSVVITTSTNDPNPVNNSSTVTTSLQSVANLQLSKTALPLQPVAGTNVTFTIRVTNTGPSQATGVVLSDVLPAGLSLITTTLSQGTFVSPTWAVGTLDVNSGATLTVVANVASTAADGTPITNTAVVSAPASTPITATATITPQRMASLQLSKTATPLQPVAGTAVTFTIRVTNTGPSQAAGIVLSDVLPNGLTLITSTESQGAFISPTWAVGTLDVGNSATLLIVANVNSDVAEGTLITNTAVVTSTNSAPITATATVQVRRSADLLIIKAGSQTSIAGTVITYTLSYTNIGPSNAQQVYITDTLPSSVIYGGVVSAPSGWAGPTLTGQTLVWFTPTLPSGASGAFVFTVTVDPAATGQVVNSVVITTSTNDPNPINNSSTVTTSLQSVANLQLSKTASPLQPVAGTNVTFTIRVTNTGPSQATGIVLSDVLPAGLSLITTTMSQGNFALSTWSVGTLDVNSSATLTVVANVASTVANGAPITNTAVVTSPVSTAITATAIITPQRMANLELSKVATPLQPVAGTRTAITFTIRVTNTGPSQAAGVVLSDVLPVGLSLDSALESQGTFISPTWAVGTLNVGDSATLTVIANVASDVTDGAPITNTAVVTSANSTPVTATATITPQRAVSLALSKTSPTFRAIAGREITYSIQITNLGPSQAIGVVVTDALPSGLTYARANVTQGSYNGANNVWTLGTLEVGQTERLTLTALAAPSVPISTVLVNVATAESTYSPPVSATWPNLSDSEANLLIEKTSTPEPVVAGERITYTLVITNLGPSDALTVTVRDPLPTQLISTTTTWTATLGTFDPLAGMWEGIGTLTPNMTATLQFSVTVTPDLVTGTQLINTAVVTSATPFDPDVPGGSATVTNTAQAWVDLQINKTDNGITTLPGGDVLYTLVYTNTGTAIATNVRITEVVPTGTTFVAALSTAGWSCADGAAAGTTCVWVAGTVNDRGGSGQIAFAVQVDQPLAAGLLVISNTVSIGDDGRNGSDVNPNDNVAIDTTPVIAAPDLQISKTDGGITTTPGSTVVYTLAYTNTGNINSRNVTLTETLPANTSFAAAASLPTVWAQVGTTSQYTTHIGTVVGLGGNGVARFAVVVQAPLPSGVRAITNTVSIGDDGVSGPDSNLNDNTASDSTPVNTRPDLAISKSDGRASVVPGDVLTYTLIISNTGNQNASGGVLTETLPPQVTLLSFSAGGVVNANQVVWTVGPLNAGSGQIFTVTVQVNSPLPAGTTTVVNTAAVTLDFGAGSVQTHTVTDTDSINAASILRISKSTDTAIVGPNQLVNYTLAYTNTGNLESTGVIITETVPNYTVFAGGAGWSCAVGSPAGTLCVLDAGTLAGGASGRAIFAVRVISVPPPGATLINVVVINDDGSTPIPGSATVTTPLAAPALTLVKTSNPASGQSVEVGDLITYVLTLNNTGTYTATQISVRDAVPANTQYVVGSAQPVPAAGPDPLQWQFAALGPQQSVVMTFSTVVLAFNINITNVATAASAEISNVASNVVIHVSLPQAITLLRFTAVPEAAGVRLAWETGSEINTFGFVLYRGTSRNRAEAMALNTMLIPAQGNDGGGAVYSFVDESAEADVVYYYWLQEVETTGKRTDYGPFSTAATPEAEPASQHRIFLPFASRGF